MLAEASGAKREAALTRPRDAAGILRSKHWSKAESLRTPPRFTRRATQAPSISQVRWRALRQERDRSQDPRGHGRRPHSADRGVAHVPRVRLLVLPAWARAAVSPSALDDERDLGRGRDPGPGRRLAHRDEIRRVRRLSRTPRRSGTCPCRRQRGDERFQAVRPCSKPSRCARLRVARLCFRAQNARGAETTRPA